MSRRVNIRIICAITAVLLASTAGAEAKATDRGKRAPAPFSPSDYHYDSCGDGAVCTHSAIADGSGRQVAAATIERAVPTLATPPRDGEYSWGLAGGAKSFRLAKAVPELRVTFTWYVNSASGTAVPASAEGASVARVFAAGSVWGCSDCLRSYETDETALDDGIPNPTDVPLLIAPAYGRVVVDAYAAGAPARDERRDQLVSHTVVLTGRDGGLVPAGNYNLMGQTRAMGYVGQVCAASARLGPVVDDATEKIPEEIPEEIRGEIPEEIRDEIPERPRDEVRGKIKKLRCAPEAKGHAGSARTQADLQLRSIAVNGVTVAASS